LLKRLKTELLVWLGYIGFLLTVLAVVTWFSGCDSGWSIAGWEIK
jgi:hypothetical protein